MDFCELVCIFGWSHAAVLRLSQVHMPYVCMCSDSKGEKETKKNDVLQSSIMCTDCVQPMMTVVSAWRPQLWGISITERQQCDCVWVGGCIVKTFITVFACAFLACKTAYMQTSLYVCISIVLPLLLYPSLCKCVCMCRRVNGAIDYGTDALFFLWLEGQAPHWRQQESQRGTVIQCMCVCYSAPGLPPSLHCSYTALSSAVSVTGKWWEVTAKDSLVLSHSLGIESPCKIAELPQTHMHTYWGCQRGISPERRVQMHTFMQTFTQVELIIYICYFCQHASKLPPHFQLKLVCVCKQ